MVEEEGGVEEDVWEEGERTRGKVTKLTALVGDVFVGAGSCFGPTNEGPYSGPVVVGGI